MNEPKIQFTKTDVATLLAALKMKANEDAKRQSEMRERETIVLMAKLIQYENTLSEHIIEA